MTQDIDEILAAITKGHIEAIQRKTDVFIYQLTNNDKGFSKDEILAVERALEHFTFWLPTWIGLLKENTPPSTLKLFDGFAVVRCNCNDLKAFVENGFRENECS